MNKFLALLAVPALAYASQEGSLKRIIDTLIEMEKAIHREGDKMEKEQEAFNCQCFKIITGLKANLAVWQSSSPGMNESLASDLFTLGQLNKTVEIKHAERAKLQKEVKAAQSARTKESASNNKALEDLASDIALTNKAINALNGQDVAFLQGKGGVDLKALVAKKLNMYDGDRKTVLAFLSQPNKDNTDQMDDDGKATNHDGMSEVIGILKQMVDDATEEKTRTAESEDTASKAHDEYFTNVQKMIKTLDERIYQWQIQIADLLARTASARTNLEEIILRIQRAQAALMFNIKICDKFKADAAEANRLREEELEAIRTAKKILAKSGMKAEKVENTVESFLQIVATKKHMVEDDKDDSGTMDKIYGLIDNMKATLKSEKDKLIKDKTECEAKLQRLSQALKDATTAKEENAEGIIEAEKEISKLREKKESLMKEIWTQEMFIQTYAKECKEKIADAIETAEENKRDLELLIQAREVLGRFYNERQFLIQQPTTNVDINTKLVAPPTAYKKQASGGVMGLFSSMIEEFKETIVANKHELEDMKETCKERSEKAEEELEQAHKTMKKTRMNLNTRLVQIDDLKEQQVQVLKAHTEAIAAQAMCKTECQLLAGNFNRRMDEIDASLTSLISAKDTLRSYQGSK